MKPLFLLAACSLLAFPTLVAASDYPPPMGPYRTPETLESIADQARAILDTLDAFPAEERDPPEGLHPGPTTTLTQLDSAGPERVSHPGREPGPASIDRGQAWDQAGSLAVTAVHPAFAQTDTPRDSANFRSHPQAAADGRLYYAQNILPGSQPDTRPYAAADPYSGSSLDSGYYGAAPAGRGYRDPGSDPGRYYPSEGYREAPEVTGSAARGTSPYDRSYYPGEPDPYSYSSPSYQPQPPQGTRSRDNSWQPGPRPSSGQASGYDPDFDSNNREPFAPSFPGGAGGTYYGGLEEYTGSYLNPAGYGEGQAGSAPEYAYISAQPPATSVPSHKASYARDSGPYGSGSIPETPPNGGWAGQYRPTTEGLASDYPVYRGDYSANRSTNRFDAPAYFAPADAPLRYRQPEPTGAQVYFGDYRFAPPAPSRDSRQQGGARHALGSGGYPGGDPIPPSAGFRDAGPVANSVTGPGGQVYRYRPIEEQHSRAPHAQTWEPHSASPQPDYRNRDRAYPGDRYPDYPDQR